MSNIEFIPGTDAQTIARLHWQSWQASYRSILPDEYLDGEVIDERTSYWQRAMASGDYWLILLAVIIDQPVGFIALKQGVDEGYDATIEHLHVATGMKGKGLGKKLIGQAMQQMLAVGMKSVCLWVFEDNKPAIGFYENLGGVTDKHGVDQLANSDAPDRRIGWHNLERLLNNCNGANR